MAYRRTIRTLPAAVLVATLFGAAGCREQPQPEQSQVAPEPAATQRPEGPPSLPIPMPPLDREKLLLAAVRAASASAAGLDDRERQSDFANKRFVFRFRFGCEGPSEAGIRRWSYDAGEEVLRAEFEPFPEAAEPDEEQDENSVRFEVERPWLLQPACPESGTTPQRPPSDGRVFLAQRFTKEESRANRLPELFRITKKVAPDSIPTSGLEFVLSGRLEEGKDGRVISCTASPDGGRPDCTIAVSLESARLQDPDTGDELASWGD